MAFISWTLLYTQMLDKLAAGDTTIGSFTIGDKSFTYRTHDDFLKLFNMVEQRAKAETGNYVPRTYAKQGGRC